MSTQLSESQLSESEARRLERKARRHENRRTLLVGAARRILERDGIENFSVNAVAVAADLSKPAVYYYFASKESLVHELAARERLQEAEDLSAALANDRGWVAALETFIRTYVGRYMDDLNRFRISYLWPQVMGVGAELCEGPARQRTQQVDELVANRLAIAQRAGQLSKTSDPRGVVSLLRASAHGIVAQSAACTRDAEAAKYEAEKLVDALSLQIKRMTGVGLS
jgi:AcrR family transcriptional regulator